MLADVLAGLRRIAETTGLPELVDAVAQLNFEFENLGHRTNALGQSINQVVASGIGDFFNTLIDGSASLGENFRKAASQMLLDIAKLIFQATILKAILGALGLNDTSGTKGVGGVLGKVLGFAEGGPINGPGTGTSDSILARLSAGEYVIPAARVQQFGVSFFDNIRAGRWMSLMPRFATGGLVQREAAASGTATGQHTRIVNVPSPGLLEDYVNTGNGERVILNIISRNESKVRQALGLA